MMFALGATAFALVADTPTGSLQPPVWLSGITVSDAWMSGLTMQNWSGSLTQQAYAEGNYIWFIARISVAAPGDTDGEHLWTGNGEDKATLTIQGKDNCLNLSSANMATLARIEGQSVTSRTINNATKNVSATSNQAKYTFTSMPAYGIDDQTDHLRFNPDNLMNLGLDGIYAADTYTSRFPDTYNTQTGNQWRPGNAATLQKDYYLHFMAICNTATEGVCVGTLRVNGEDQFTRQGSEMRDDWKSEFSVPYSTPTQLGDQGTPSDYMGYNNWYYWQRNGGTYGYNWDAYNEAQYDRHTLKPGDRSVPVILYNTYNRITYAIAEINGEAVASTGMNHGWRGPYGNGGSIYVLMSQDCQDFKVGFAVSGGAFQGLVSWNDDFRDGSPVLDNFTGGKAGDFDFFHNWHTWNAAYYIPLTSNETSGGANNLVASYNGGTMSTGELEAIFNFFGFAYTNPRAPTDADFLLNSALTSTQEVRYNVANAVVTTPDNTIVIPQTGDAASSTGLILVASAILAAAAVGFVLSKRAKN